MPELPELHNAGQFVNKVARGRVFSGPIWKSDVSKCPDVAFDAETYTVTAETRGKELALILDGKVSGDKTKRLRILFHFGMSGRFMFGRESERHKHAHLNFTAAGEPVHVLSFVDTRRFGSWCVSDDWGPQRGPDPVFDYAAFRQNVIDSLEMAVFDKPICEVVMDQRFFNGIGNYLRAEILHRQVKK